MDELYLFAFANFVLCGGVAFISFCRLNRMHGAVLDRVKSEYAAYMAAGIAAAVQPWWGEWPRWGSLSIAGALLIGLLCSSYVWRDGPPKSASKGEP
jgi:hypothetical protein